MEALTALLESLTPAQREVVEKAKGEWERTVAQIKRLEIEVEHQRLLILELRRARYGAKGEKLSTLQLDLLDLEPGVSAKEVEAEAGQADPSVSSEESSKAQDGHILTFFMVVPWQSMRRGVHVSMASSEAGGAS